MSDKDELIRVMAEVTGEDEATARLRLDEWEAATAKIDAMAAEYEAKTGKPFIEFREDV